MARTSDVIVSCRFAAAAQSQTPSDAVHVYTFSWDQKLISGTLCWFRLLLGTQKLQSSAQTASIAEENCGIPKSDETEIPNRAVKGVNFVNCLLFINLLSPSISSSDKQSANPNARVYASLANVKPEMTVFFLRLASN